ncbi:Uncharacterized protein DBV15_07251 [Temnothorax longispinosus]|uniref:Uncharacterized protein n=1 Tax=Temnothorax longispinosus TaxID=300112 RepID=A0A4S2JJ47_9HYME|nr:Uncharacterized protein DBV15_07251 [Temnothorax longispinosus]
MNEDWLAEPVCWGFGSVYRVALMSGGSRRLWNQLLRGTPSFVLSSLFNPLSHSWLRAYSPAFSALFIFSLHSASSPSLSLYLYSTSGVRTQVYRLPMYMRIPLLSFHNLRQLRPRRRAVPRK